MLTLCLRIVFFVGYCTGVTAAPQLWTDPPRYLNGVICALVDGGLVYVFIPWYWWLCWNENRRRDAMDGEAMGAFQAGLDSTDKTDLSFRYTT